MSVIQIKRSANIGAPSTSVLAEGELAYSYDKSNDGAGAKLYIEVLDSGDSQVIHAIGGKYYTDIIDSASDTTQPSTLVIRDNLGSFSGNVITAAKFVGNIEGTIEGVASQAVRLQTARNITLGGDLEGNAYFDGTGDITIYANVLSDTVVLGTDTTGNYVANILAGTGISIADGAGESATPTISLSTSGVSAATYGNATFIPVITVDTYGRVTSAANVAVAGVSNFSASGNTFTVSTADGGSFSASIQENSVRLGTDTTGNYIANVIPGTGLTGADFGTEGATPTISLQNTAVSPGVYGGSSQVPTFTVDQQGRITQAANVAVATSLELKGDDATDSLDLTSEVLTILGGTGVSTSLAGNAFTITNTGVTSAQSGGYGLTVSSTTGDITITNTGVTRLASGGHGISLDANNGNVTVTNNGVTAITGTANEIEVDASTGNVIIGLPTNVTVSGDLSVAGELNVLGNLTYLDSEHLSIGDPLIHLANTNTVSDTVDIGFIGHYYNTTYSVDMHAGLFRDASDSGKFKLFSNVAADLHDVNVIDTSSEGYTVGTLVANLTGGTVSSLTSAIGVADGGTGASSFTTNGVLYGQGTSALAVATGSAGQVLQLNGSGVPVFGSLDGGTY